jgi:hypothetical protein
MNRRIQNDPPYVYLDNASGGPGGSPGNWLVGPGISTGPVGPAGPPGPTGPIGPIGPPGQIGTLIGSFDAPLTPADLPPNGVIPADWNGPGDPPTSVTMNVAEGLLYTPDGHIWVYTGTTYAPGGWVDGGLIQGPEGPVGPAGPPGPSGSSVTISDTAPAAASTGDLWWDSIGGQLYIYYFDGNSAQWVVVVNSPSGGGGGGGGGIGPPGPQGPVGPAGPQGPPGVSFPDAPTDGQLYGRQNAAWAIVTVGGGGITDAPIDGTSYMRRNGIWTNILDAETF